MNGTKAIPKFMITPEVIARAIHLIDIEYNQGRTDRTTYSTLERAILATMEWHNINPRQVARWVFEEWWSRDEVH